MKMLNTKNRIIYLDILRGLAIILILFWHVSNNFPTNLTNWKCSISFLALARIGIPLFLMISGALILNRKNSNIKDFFKKKIKRLFIPYILWVIIYFALGLTLIHDMYGLYYYDTPASLSIEYFCSVLFSLSAFSSILWFIWCIFGFYLAVHILDSFIRDYELKGLEYILIIAFICAIIPTLSLENSSIADRIRFIKPFFLCYFYL